MEKKDEAKRHIMIAAHELMQAAGATFSWLKGEAISDKKRECLVNLFERGISLTDEFRSGIVGFLDCLEKELKRGEKGKVKKHVKGVRNKGHKAVSKQKALRHR